jgi:hypothetical protein
MDEHVIAFDWTKRVVIPDDGQAEAIRWAMGYTRLFADRINLTEMTPQNDLISTAYCLAKQGSEYPAYQPKSSPFTVTLAPGKYFYEWFNPATGKTVKTGRIAGNGKPQTFEPLLTATLFYT